MGDALPSLDDFFANTSTDRVPTPPRVRGRAANRAAISAAVLATAARRRLRSSSQGSAEPRLSSQDSLGAPLSQMSQVPETAQHFPSQSSLGSDSDSSSSSDESDDGSQQPRNRLDDAAQSQPELFADDIDDLLGQGGGELSRAELAAAAAEVEALVAGEAVPSQEPSSSTSIKHQQTSGCGQQPQQERRRISFGATSFSQPSDGSSSDSSEDELRHDPRSDSDGSDGDSGPPGHAPRSAYRAEADVGFYQSKSVAIHNNPTDDDDGVGEFDMLGDGASFGSFANDDGGGASDSDTSSLELLADELQLVSTRKREQQRHCSGSGSKHKQRAPPPRRARQQAKKRQKPKQTPRGLADVAADSDSDSGGGSQEEVEEELRSAEDFAKQAKSITFSSGAASPPPQRRPRKLSVKQAASHLEKVKQYFEEVDGWLLESEDEGEERGMSQLR